MMAMLCCSWSISVRGSVRLTAISSPPSPPPPIITLTPPAFSPNPRVLRLVPRAAQHPLQFEHGDRESYKSTFNLEPFLSAIEAVCLFSAAVLSIGFAFLPGSSRALGAAAVLTMAAASGIGAWQRRRGGTGPVPGTWLEEDMNKWAEMQRMTRAVARQVEKVGNRMRVMRRALKEPMAETAALSQKNFEETRVLAEQHRVLEMELSEMQKVLLAMQEQQQKQLQLILAIANATRTAQHQQHQHATTT